MSFHIEPHAQGLGARVLGLDLSQPVSAADRLLLIAALGRHGVLCYPRQTLTPRQVRDFASNFGTLEINVAGAYQEADLPDLRPGARVALVVPSLAQEPVQATVQAVTDQIDPLSRTIKVRATVANPQRLLKNEMLARARYERQVGQSLAVPASAVFLRGSQHFVFVQGAPGLFETRDVRVVHEGPQRTLVGAGLREGELVVSENGLLLARELRLAQEATHTGGQPK